jgi:hypothetical protein
VQVVKRGVEPSPPDMNTFNGQRVLLMPRDVSFEQLLVGPGSSLTKFVGLSYCVDYSWLASVVPLSASLTLYVYNNHGQCEEPLPEFRAGSGRRRTVRVGDRTLDVVLVGGDGAAMHAKLWLLWFGADLLRVVVGSCNLTSDDCHTMAQQLWACDFSRTAQQTPSSEFGELLLEFVQRLDGAAEEEVATALQGFDFGTTDARLVMSVPGVVDASSAHRYGHMRLRELVRSCGVAPHGVVIQAAAVGNFSRGWFDDFCASCTGASGDVDIRLLYPSRATAMRALETSAAPICIKFLHGDRKWLMPQLWDHVDSQCYHCKSVFDARGQWVCISSHNINPNSWGTINGRTGHLLMKNFELGVFLQGDGSVAAHFIPLMLPYAVGAEPWVLDVELVQQAIEKTATPFRFHYCQLQLELAPQ